MIHIRAVCAFGTLLSLGFAQETETASRVYAQAAKSVFLIVIRSAEGRPIGQATGFLVDDKKIVTNASGVTQNRPVGVTSKPAS